MSLLILDRWHVHVLHNVRACIAASETVTVQQWRIVLEWNQAFARSVALESVNLCKERLESVNKGKGHWQVRTLFRRSAGPSSNPCVAVFISVAYKFGKDWYACISMNWVRHCPVLNPHQSLMRIEHCLCGRLWTSCLFRNEESVSSAGLKKKSCSWTQAREWIDLAALILTWSETPIGDLHCIRVYQVSCASAHWSVTPRVHGNRNFRWRK